METCNRLYLTLHVLQCHGSHWIWKVYCQFPFRSHYHGLAVHADQFINLVSESDLLTSDGLKSCASDVEFSRIFELSGRSVRLIDTPGFDDTTRSDTEVLKMIALSLAQM